ncbi:hypothetical protein [Dyella sp.]
MLANFQFGLAQGKARHFSFLSDDDVLFPSFSKVQLPDLKLFPGSRSGAE